MLTPLEISVNSLFKDLVFRREQRLKNWQKVIIRFNIINIRNISFERKRKFKIYAIEFTNNKK